ncbi:MAG: hypothetical protein IJE10_07440 [Clostridia bacterium]|nr:hypothetical protein [Clostridia bacterium]
MKKVLCVICVLCLCMSWFTVQASEAPIALEAILGSAENILAENFSGTEPKFLEASFTKNDITSMPGWGMVASGSNMVGVDVSELGEKTYVIPLSEGQLSQDIGIRFTAAESKPGRALLDVWNIPVANITGADKYRFEYNVFIRKAGTGSGLIADVSTYTKDVPGATTAVGLIGFMYDGTVGICKKGITTYEPILKADGTPLTFTDNSWQHVVLDFDVEKGTFDFTLNGQKVLSGAKPANVIHFHATEGTYRFRLAYTPSADAPESMVVYDDVLFAKHVKEAIVPTFAFLNEKDGTQNGKLKDLSENTEAFCFQNASGVTEDFIDVLEDGKKIQFEVSEKNGVLFVKPESGFKAGKTYSVAFNRFTSTDGKTFTDKSTVFTAYCHKLKLTGVLQDATVKAKILDAENKTVKLLVTRYNSEGTMIEAWQSDLVTLQKDVAQAIDIPLNGFVKQTGDTIEITAFENIGAPYPLSNAVVIQ